MTSIDFSTVSPSQSTPLLTRIGNGLIDAFVALANFNSRYRMLEEFSSMSDDELAKHGLKRDQIVQHVFKTSYYL